MSRKGRRGTWLTVTLLFTAVAFCITASGFAQTPKRGGWLKVATDDTAIGLDPHLSLTNSTFTFTEHVYDTLLRFNYKGQLEPSLALSWKQPNPTTYIFSLRKGVKFHNGREMTADDVVYSFKRILDPKTGSPSAATFEMLKSVEAVDRYTVKFVLSKTMPGFLSYCGFVRNSAIVPREEVEKRGTLQKDMIGTGPFKLKEYKHGSGATFVRNEQYWEEGLPYIDGFDFVVIKDEASRLAGIRRGTLDIGWLKEVQMAEMAAKTPGTKLIESAASRQGRFWLNHKKFPFNNQKLRQAVAASLDHQAIIDKVLMGHGSWSTCIPPSEGDFILSQEEIKKLPFYRQDYTLAKKLMAEAGYPNGFEFTIITSPHSPDYVPACEIIQQQLAKAGIRAKIQQMEWGAFQKIRRNVDFQANFFAGSWRADATDYFYSYFHGESDANEVGAKDPEMDKLMDLCMTTTDFEKRKAYRKELQVKFAEKVMGIFPYAMSGRFDVVADHVKGYQFMPNTGRAYLRQTWIDKK